MSRETDVTPNDSCTIVSTTTSEVALLNSARSSPTICTTSTNIGKLTTNSNIDWEEVSENQANKDSKELTVIDIEGQSNAYNETLENMKRELGESITIELRKIYNMMDEQQKANADAKEYLGNKLNCLDQKVEKLDERRIQAKNYHHELRRRFECFENKVNKNYLK